MTTALTPYQQGDLIEQVIIKGDLAKLTPNERVSYYRHVCQSVGLNELTKPFEYITLNGRLTLYARKDATDQLRRIHSVSVEIANRERVEDVYVVTARATTPDGRTDESTGAVAIGNLKSEALANALMKAETKAKRRVTLSICGMGWLDETEVGSIPDARPANVDTSTGEIIDAQPAPTNGRPRNAQEASDRFYAKFGKTIGGQDWKAVQEYLRSRAPKPTTVEGWIAAAEAVRDEEKAKAAADEGSLFPADPPPGQAASDWKEEFDAIDAAQND